MLGRDIAEMEEEKSEEEIEKDEDEEEGKESENLKNQLPKIKYNQKCPKHNLIQHSFLKRTKELLCN